MKTRWITNNMGLFMAKNLYTRRKPRLQRKKPERDSVLTREEFESI